MNDAVSEDWRPPHAYVPGRTPRHPETLFDDIKAGLSEFSPRDIHISQAWRLGCIFLDEGYFWEAHEVLEAVWSACPANSAEKMLVQAIIQTANARLKAAMGWKKAHARLEADAERLWRDAFLRAGPMILGQRFEDLRKFRSASKKTAK